MIQGPQRASLDDFDSLIELVDECFPHDRDTGGMLARWPHCYIPRPEKLRNALIIKDGPKVVSHVGYVDQTVLVEGREIKVAGITGVATWPSYRGRGFMAQLLDCCIRLMREEGYAFSDLGGDRQRYGHFGWETAGREWSFEITRRSLHAAGGPTSLEVTPYRARSEEIDAIVALHEREPLRMKRTRDLYEMLLGRKGKEVWLATGREGVAAYVVAHPNDRYQGIDEFGGSAEGVHAIFVHLTEVLGSEALHLRSPWSHPLNVRFFSISAGWHVSCMRMIKMLDLEATLRGFANQLAARYRDRGLQGRRTIVLGVDETDQRAEVEFSPEGVIVRQTSDLPRSLMLSERQMVRFLFGPGSPGATVSLPPDARFLEALLPVDFYLWHNETV